jgi:hypothetical protein
MSICHNCGELKKLLDIAGQPRIRRNLKYL